MNWTGGGLSRHSHSRGGVAGPLNQRQKAKIPMAQNNARKGAKKTSPIKWSIFGQTKAQQAVSEMQFSSRPRRAYGTETQPITHGKSPYTENSSFVSRDKRMFRSIEPHNTRESTPGPPKPKHLDNDLYSATPQPRNKRMHEVFAAGIEVDLEPKKRQRLLERGDWVGISYQRPLQLKFDSPKHSDNVGRRRKVTDSRRARYANQNSTLASSFITRARPSSLQYSDTRQRAKTNMRIHIGGRDDLQSLSSSMASSMRRGNSAHGEVREQSQVASSDVMLLDNVKNLSNASSELINEAAFGRRDDERFDSDPCSESHHNADGNIGNERGCEDYESMKEKVFRSNENGQQFEGEVDSEQYNYDPFVYEIAVSTSNMPQEPASHILVIGCSPRLIQHPIPQSSKVSSILRSASSEIADSTAVQVGTVKPVVPSSQILDNEIWETWMTSLYDDEQCYDRPEEGGCFDQDISISPGISTAPVYRIKRPSAQLYRKAIIGSDNEELEDIGEALKMINPSTHSSSISKSPIDRGESLRHLSGLMAQSQSVKRHVDYSVKSIDRNVKRKFGISNLGVREDEASTQRRIENLDLLQSKLRVENCVSQIKSSARARKEEDPDAVWRDFVFGSDEISESSQTSKPKIFPGLEGHDATALLMEGNASTGPSVNTSASARRQKLNTPSLSDFAIQTYTLSATSNADSSSSDIPWDPPKRAASIACLSITDDNASLHASQGSLDLTYSDLAIPYDYSALSSNSDLGAASVAGMASSP